jgi:hypothetical protein
MRNLANTVASDKIGGMGRLRRGAEGVRQRLTLETDSWYPVVRTIGSVAWRRRISRARSSP